MLFLSGVTVDLVIRLSVLTFIIIHTYHTPQVIESKGGYMARLSVKNFNDASQHTIITSRDLYQETIKLAGKPDFSIEDYFKAVIKFMIGRGMSLQNTEGMIDAGIFPINYFSVSQLAHFMDDTVTGVAEVIKDM